MINCAVWRIGAVEAARRGERPIYSEFISRLEIAFVGFEAASRSPRRGPICPLPAHLAARRGAQLTLRSRRAATATTAHAAHDYALAVPRAVSCARTARALQPVMQKRAPRRRATGDPCTLRSAAARARVVRRGARALPARRGGGARASRCCCCPTRSSCGPTRRRRRAGARAATCRRASRTSSSSSTRCRAPSTPTSRAGRSATACATIAAAARLVHPSRQCVAVVTKRRSACSARAPRRARAARGCSASTAWTPCCTSRWTIRRARLDASGDLMLDGHRISVLYFEVRRARGQRRRAADCGAILRRPIHHARRYDFSHPSGSYLDAAGAAALEQWSEWPTIERIEASNAVLSSDLDVGWRTDGWRSTRSAAAAASSAFYRRRKRPRCAACYRGSGRSATHQNARRRASSSTRAAPEPSSRRICCGRARAPTARRTATRPAARRRRGRRGDRRPRGVGGRCDVGAIRVVRTGDRAHARGRPRPPRRPPPPPARNLGGRELRRAPRAARAAAGAAADGDGEGDEGGGVNVHAGFGARTRPAAADHPLAAELGYGALGCVQRLGASGR